MKPESYLLEEKLPHFWCPGCGNGIVLGALLRSMAKKDMARENTVIVTGIGCWGKADDYIKTNTFHGTHGRALAFATGIKLANDDLNVIVLMGDGDAATIGGNHLIHTARRNVNLTAIIVNNHNYGMTGGQYSGTTPRDSITKTSPYGHVENGFDICQLVKAAGGSFVARATVFDVVQLDRLIYQALDHKSFSLVEVVSPCPTHFGRYNKMPEVSKMMMWIKNNTVSIQKSMAMSSEELKGKFITGVFASEEMEDYNSVYQKIIDSFNVGDGA